MKKYVLVFFLFWIFTLNALSQVINFEDGKQVGNVENTIKYSYDGCNSGKVQQNTRTDFTKFSFTKSVIKGGNYGFCVYIKQDPVISLYKDITFNVGVLYNGVRYDVVSETIKPYGDFVEIKGEYAHNGDSGEIEIFVYANENNVSYYVDNISFFEKSLDNIISNGNFENTNEPLIFGADSYSQAYKKSGDYSLRVRAKSTFGGLTNIQAPTIKPGKEYYYSLWVRLDKFTFGQKQLNFAIEYSYEKLDNIIEKNISTTLLAGTSDFVNLCGIIKIPNGILKTPVKLKLIAIDSGVTYYVDDFEIKETMSPKITKNPDISTMDKGIIQLDFDMPMIKDTFNQNTLTLEGADISSSVFSDNNKCLTINYVKNPSVKNYTLKLNGVKGITNYKLKDTQFELEETINYYNSLKYYLDYQKPTQKELLDTQIVNGTLSYVVDGFNENTPRNIIMCMGLYKGNKLVDLQCEEVDTKLQNNCVVSLNVNKENLKDYYIKIFIWDKTNFFPLKK